MGHAPGRGQWSRTTGAHLETVRPVRAPGPAPPMQCSSCVPRTPPLPAPVEESRSPVVLLRMPTSLSEAQRYLAEGAVPVGGATLVWALWQRDGFPEQAMSLRELPQATLIQREALGAAVLLHQVDDRVPEVLRRAASSVGTGAVRRAATVGGNIVGSTLRCLLPAALVLDARATVLDRDGSY